MPRRRDLMLGAGALAAQATRALAGPEADGALGALLSRHMDEYLAMSPEAAAQILADGRGRGGAVEARRPLAGRQGQGRGGARGVGAASSNRSIVQP